MKILPTTKFAKIRIFLLFSIIAYLLLYPLIGYMKYQPKEGDLIFQPLPFGELTKVIEGVTDSLYSHVGILVKKDGTWYVREAIGKVKDTNLYMWIARGRQSRFAVYQFKKEYQKFIPAVLVESEKLLGLPYDFFYELDDEKIYCSELIFKSYKQVTDKNLGKLVKLKDLNWKPYEEFILSVENKIPLERVMITPKDLSQAKELKKVFSNGI